MARWRNPTTWLGRVSWQALNTPPACFRMMTLKTKFINELFQVLIPLSLWMFIVIIVLAGRPQRCQANPFPHDEVNCYIEKDGGQANPDEDPLVKRSHEIFKRVRAVADKRGTYLLPKLVITKNVCKIRAIPLSKHIVLSLGALKICYENTPLDTGDARVAFVLGHELGHMAMDDSRALEEYNSMAGDPEFAWLLKNFENSEILPETKDANARERPSVARIKEIYADKSGFMWAGIAGFAVDTLVNDQAGNVAFFRKWVKQKPHKTEDVRHPCPEDRVKLLQSRLKILLESLEYFKYGVRLAQFEQYERALNFFSRFQKVFPSREVFNGIGYCLLKLAIDEMPLSIAYHYWLPTTLDPLSRAEELILKGSSEEPAALSPETIDLLDEATVYFKKACDADAHYWPSRIDLATTYYYLGRIHDARAMIEEALRLTPDLEDAKTIKALILFKENPTTDKMRSESVQLLEDIVSKNRYNLCALYNLMTLYEDLGRSGKADKLWPKLAAKAENLPQPIRKSVSNRIAVKAIHTASRPSPPHFPWKQPFKIGTDLYENEASQKTIDGWEQTPFKGFSDKLEGRMLKSTEGYGVLEFDGRVRIIVLTGDHLGTMKDLIQRFGSPLQSRKIGGGQLVQYSDQWCALVVDRRLKEIWIAGESSY